LVRQHIRPGSRVRLYRIQDEMWESVVRMQVESLASFTTITQEALNLLGPKSERAGRVRAAHRVFVWMKDVFEHAPPLPSRSKQDG
jgi:hypothetical protein